MIAREGLVPISVACVAAAAVASYAGALWSLPLWALAAYLLYLFRETVPAIPNLPLAVLSPGDGRVIEVTNARDPWLDRDSCRIRIELDGLGVGVLRSPIEGKVMDYWTSAQPCAQPGALRATGFSPNCYSAWVQTDEGDDIVFAVSSLRPISRFKLYFAPGERVGIGQRSGFIYFGSTVDVLMPANTRPEVAAGSKVESGCTVLGHLVRGSSSAREAAQTS
jgi:phosphatidylserine decarboxylase